jgi:hypothetical protein
VNLLPRLSWLRDWRVVVLAASCAVVGFLTAALIFGPPWHLPPDWGDIPTWLAVAVATVGGGIALSQLRQQQNVIRDEIERNKKRDDLVDGQLRELADRERSRQREQAEGIDMTWNDPADAPGKSLVMVINGSRRPSRDVTCTPYPDALGNSVRPDHAVEMDLAEFPQKISTMPEKPAGLRRPITELESLRGGDRAGFIFLIRQADSPGGYAKVEFTDDARCRWKLFSDLALSPVTIDAVSPTGI